MDVKIDRAREKPLPVMRRGFSRGALVING
jgi:hypothetical protein